jgi:hypothetical protein
MTRAGATPPLLVTFDRFEIDPTKSPASGQKGPTIFRYRPAGPVNCGVARHLDGEHAVVGRHLGTFACDCSSLLYELGPEPFPAARSLPRWPLPQPDAWPAAVLVDELRAPAYSSEVAQFLL